jgi:RimJ/RimL family protein N-acetyltransferase
MEQDSENAPTIRQWSREKHIAAIADSNYDHITVRACSDDRIVGYIILVGLDDPDDNVEFKRIVIAEKGRGLGRAAVKYIKEHAFNDLGAHRLWLEVMTNNERAYQLYESEGFIREGVHRESLKRGDTYDSLIVMSVLAQEFRESEQGTT